jgi:hypothetical protein
MKVLAAEAAAAMLNSQIIVAIGISFEMEG